jgi:hypothetical protein
MQFDCFASRAVRAGVGALLVVAAVSMSTGPAAASGFGGGFMDSTITGAYEGPYTAVVTYPVMYFYGHLELAGQSYDGGFYVTGMTVTTPVTGGQCYGVCDPVRSTSWVGRDAGAVHGFDPNSGGVTGSCAIVDQVTSTTGPFYFVEVRRSISLACTVSLLGGPPSSFSVQVTAKTDGVGNLEGVYTVG